MFIGNYDIASYCIRLTTDTNKEDCLKTRKYDFQAVLSKLS